MLRRSLSHRPTTIALIALLAVECLLVVSMRTLGWFGTGNVIQLGASAIATLLPLLAAVWILVANRLRFSLRSILIAVGLVAVFLAASMKPLIDYRAARSASAELLDAGDELNEGLDRDEYYANLDLPPPPVVRAPSIVPLPVWLAAFNKESAAIPPDDTVRSIWFDSDRQIQIFVDNWQRFPSLQTVAFTPGVTDAGLKRVDDVLPRLKHLHTVQTSSVVPPPGWYRSITNIHTLFVWGEGAFRRKPLPREYYVDIAALSNLEVIDVFGWAFSDSDARTLSKSPSLKRVILRHTAVTDVGEEILSESAADRKVFPN